MQKKMLVGGKWREGRESYELRSPYDNRKIADIPSATLEDVEDALTSAAIGAGIIRNMTALERSQILERVSDLFNERKEECARILADENAKPIRLARAEIQRTIETYKFAAEEAKRIYGETIPMDAALAGKGRIGFTIREPLGIIGAITPFNFPFNLVAHKLGPAIAAGNSVVLKPAKQTPLSALKTAEFFLEAGLPEHVLNVVTGSGGLIGDALVKDPRVKMITFTGSVEVGKAIREKAGLKRVTLELGSNSAVIVDSVDDLDAVVNRCVEGSFSFSGQVCISVQRIYVQRQLFDAFVEKFKAAASRLKVGDPHDEETDISALISPAEKARIHSWIAEAVSQGAQVAFGGEERDGILVPTVIINSTTKMTISCREAFAPVVNIVGYDDWDEAIALANDSDYGLQAGVYTQSVAKAIDAIRRLEVGGVIINDIPSFRVDHMPYGGVKDSGTGREGVKYAVEEMTELKFASIKY
mgnify:FL=1